MHHLLAASFDDIVRFQIPVWDKVLRTVVVYALIYLLMRLAKRDAAQLTASDFVVVLLLSNVVQNAIIGPDDSLLGGAVGAVTLIVVNELVARWEWARKKEGSEPAGPLVMLRSLWATRAEQVRLIEDGHLRERRSGASVSPNSTCSRSFDDRGSGTRAATWSGRRSARAAPSTTSSRNRRRPRRRKTSTVSTGNSVSSGTRWAGSRRPASILPDGHRTPARALRAVPRWRGCRRAGARRDLRGRA